jgi:hypothetical protein
MIKISANVSKKVPMPGIDYSSQQFGAAMEIEVSDADRPEAVQQRLKELYTLLARTIDDQIAEAAQLTLNTTSQPQLPMPQRQINAPQPSSAPASNTVRQTAPGNGRNGRAVYATQAQQRAIFAICKSLNLDMAAILAQYNVTDASQLTVKDASYLIDALKSQNGNGAPARQ